MKELALNIGDGLYEEEEAIYFAIVRDDMNTYIASRIMEVGFNKQAEEIFKELVLDKIN